MPDNVIGAAKPLPQAKVILRKSGARVSSTEFIKENSEPNTKVAQPNSEKQTKIISTNKETKGA